MNRIYFFIKTLLVVLHVALFTKKMTGKGATLEAGYHCHCHWMRSAALPETNTTAIERDIRIQDQYGYLYYLRGVTNTASTNHVNHPITLCHTHAFSILPT